ncbi:unnamed protein product [Alopecurus aequalis]
MAASAARSLMLFSSASLGLGRASSRLAVSSSGLLPRPALAFRGRSAFAATAVVMGKAGTADAEADAGMSAVQRRLMFEDECILVDEQDNVTGHESKYNCHLMEKIESGHALHRAFSVFLFNSKYELLLQQRSTTKVTFPLVWTNTCCSHPLYRESELIEENCEGVRTAAQRKLFDELGIQAEDLPVDQFIPLGKMLYKAPSDGKWGEHERKYLPFVHHRWISSCRAIWFCDTLSYPYFQSLSCRSYNFLTHHYFSGLPPLHGSRRETQPKPRRSV